MSDTACGYARQPTAPSWTQKMLDCEQAAWDHFVEHCPGCANATCTLNLYKQYLDARAACLGDDPECGCGG